MIPLYMLVVQKFVQCFRVTGAFYCKLASVIKSIGSKRREKDACNIFCWKVTRMCNALIRTIRHVSQSFITPCNYCTRCEGFALFTHGIGKISSSLAIGSTYMRGARYSFESRVFLTFHVPHPVIMKISINNSIKNATYL